MLRTSTPIDVRSNVALRVQAPRGARRFRLAATRDATREVDSFEHFVLDLQRRIVTETESVETSGRRFCEDRWEREGDSGFGVTRVLENGTLLEKAAVNVSIINGILTPERAQAISQRQSDLAPKGGEPYSAASLSLVFHPMHPFVPTLRADVRRFSVEGRTWFGGGADLTPAYLFEEDAQEFHSGWKRICDSYAPDLYPKFKTWCDEYFYLPARSEHRGIGGIFFDNLDSSSTDFDVENFVRDVAEHFLPSWTPIVQRRAPLPYNEEARQWQLQRRGRYLEFNLLYDRGVRFGLQGGRIESVMVSAPPLVAWNYDVQPKPNSPEAQLIAVLKSPVDWVHPS